MMVRVGITAALACLGLFAGYRLYLSRKPEKGDMVVWSGFQGGVPVEWEGIVVRVYDHNGRKVADIKMGESLREYVPVSDLRVTEKGVTA